LSGDRDRRAHRANDRSRRRIGLGGCACRRGNDHACDRIACDARRRKCALRGRARRILGSGGLAVHGALRTSLCEPSDSLRARLVHHTLTAVTSRRGSAHRDRRYDGVRGAVRLLLRLSRGSRVLRDASDGQSVARRRRTCHLAGAAREAARAIIGVERTEAVTKERSAEASAHEAESESGTAAKRSESAVAATSAIEFGFERARRIGRIEAGAELIEACRRGRIR